MYYQYVDEVRARARQIVDGTAAEAANPVDLKYWVEEDLLKSTVALGLISVVTVYNSLTDEALRIYLVVEYADSRTIFTLSSLDHIIPKYFKMYMRNKDAISHMKTLFVNYHTLLRRHGLAWLLEENQKMAVQHVLSAIQP